MSDAVLQTFQAPDLVAENAASGQRYTEFLRVPAMSAGIYALHAGSEDLQQPHNEDEIYFVLRGRSKFVCAGEVIEARAGSFIYVAAHADHRFFDIEEDLEIIVLFAPEET
jgi:mannose-6-phosphate isomerase-like protein (cupin superfamily)